MNRNFLFCHKCGLEIKVGCEYCEACGTPIQDSIVAAHQKRVDAYSGAIQKPLKHTQNHTYVKHPACQQNPIYNPSTPNISDPVIAEISKKIDILQANQSLTMQNNEKILKKYAKRNSVSIAVLGILLGMFILSCIILSFVLIFLTSDTVKSIINIIDEINLLL